jgi:hypothetical protein
MVLYKKLMICKLVKSIYELKSCLIKDTTKVLWFWDVFYRDLCVIQVQWEYVYIPSLM